MRRSIYILTLVFLTAANLLVAAFAYGQAPAITSFEPMKGSYGEIVTINGSDFAPKADLQVSFGQAVAKITESNATTIKVAVPAGAAYAPITVTNLLPNGLSAQSSESFLLSFGGLENGVALFEPFKKYAVPISQKLYDVCACDLNGDGKNDLAGSNPSSTAISIYPNSSAPGAISLSAPSTAINLGLKTEFVSCGDLNGDGKPDLVFSGSGIDSDKLVILQNTSSAGILSFAGPGYLFAPNIILGKPAIQDLDGDGYPELTLTNQSGHQLIVFKNTSTAGISSFDDAFLRIPVAAATGPTTYGLRLKDINKDGLIDITASQYYGSEVFFLINKSTPGNILFEPAQQISAANGISNHELEDMDGDGKADLITTDFFNNTINIYLNNSSDASLSFSPVYALMAGRPMGLQLGDLNGDKKFDILIGNNNKAEATGFINTSTAGNLSFTPVLFTDPFASTGKFAHVQISDLDGDAKPDVISADRENGFFYVFRNQTCLYPTINPSGTVNICGGSTVILSSIQSPGSESAEGGSPRVTYEWFKNGNPVGTGYSLEVISAGSYAVKMSSLEGCSASSSPVIVNLFSESLGNPTFDPVTTSCEGQPLTLSVSPAIEGATYIWTNKISGFSSTTTTNTLQIPATDPTIHGGVYKVSIIKQCQLEVESPAISISPLPSAASISVDGGLAICAGENRTLKIAEGFAAYQWKKDGISIANAKSPQYTATAAGAYSVLIKNASGCEVESEIISLESTGNLQAAFAAPALACLGQPVQFSNTSTWTAGKAVSYYWDFGDGNISSSQSPTHTFTQTGSAPLTVSLTIEYEGTACKSVATHPIIVTTTPPITIATLGSTAICPSDSVKVELSGEIASASWSNGTTGIFTYAKVGGTLQADILTAAGCTTTKAIEITALEGPVLEISADKTEIGRGETANLQAFGGISYSWEPAESLNDPTIANPTASPEKTTTYKVTAQGAGGCSTTGELTITVDNSFNIEAPKLFIPATDQSWTIKNIENYPEVSLIIINKFGRNVFTASPYQNNWNGTDKGTQLNDGVYFYVFKDPSGQIVKTGSITLVR